MQRIDVTSKPAIINGADLANQASSAEESNRSAISIPLSGAAPCVLGYTPMRRGSLIEPLTTTAQSITQKDYQVVTAPSGKQYKVYRSGEYAEEGEHMAEDRVRDAHPIADFVLQSDWPRVAKGGVTIASSGNDAIAPIAFDAVPGQGPSISATVNGPIRSDSTLRLFVVSQGDQEAGTYSVKVGTETLASGAFTTPSDNGYWTTTILEFSLTRRLRTQEVATLLVTIPGSTGGGSSILGAIELKDIWSDMEVTTIPLPDGGLIVHVDNGWGVDAEGKTVTITASTVYSDLSNDSLYVWAENIDKASVERAVKAGRGLSATRMIEREAVGMLRCGPVLPTTPHIPLLQIAA
jgi:hypothetical protein